MPSYTILVCYTDKFKRTGTARLRVKATDPTAARRKAVQELEEFSKYSSRPDGRAFEFDTIQVVEQADPRREEGLLITRNNIHSGVEVWEFKGTIDANTNRQFEELIEEAVREGTHRIVLDFKGVEYINSSGIGTIVSTSSEINIRIANLPQKIAEVFLVIGLDQLLAIFFTVDEALKDF